MTTELTTLMALIPRLNQDREEAEERAKKAESIGDMRNELGFAAGISMAIGRILMLREQIVQDRERSVLHSVRKDEL